MTRETFKKLMTEFIEIRNAEYKLNEAFKVFEPDFNYVAFSRYATLFISTIEEAMNDKEDWISYWVYELNFGKDAHEESVKDKDGKSIPIKTIDGLYNLIQSKI